MGDAEREQMRRLHARGMSCNEIAKQLGRSAATVSSHCKAMGLLFDRAATEAAVHAHAVDAKARRAILQLDYLSDAERLRKQLWERCKYEAPVGGEAPLVLTWEREEPTFPDKEKIVRASALMADKHMKLSEFDSAGGADQARSMLSQLGEALGVAAQALREEQPPGT